MEERLVLEIGYKLDLIDIMRDAGYLADVIQIKYSHSSLQNMSATK